MLDFYRTRHNLRNADLWGGSTRMHTLPGGERVPATSKFVVGHLRFHHFHRATDEDFHNHQFEFWTFPLQSYLEEVLIPIASSMMPPEQQLWARHQQVVPAGRWSYRDTRTPHRILGPCAPDGERYSWDERHIRTVIWRGAVIPPGSTGFYLPTEDPYRYTFLTFEQYTARQREHFIRTGENP